MTRPTHRPSTAAGLALAAALLIAAVPVTAAPGITSDTLTDEHVRKAIDAIVEDLYRRKKPRHFWDPDKWQTQHGSRTQAGGYTALTVLALLYAGESYQDPRLRDAVARLERIEMNGTYAIAVRTSIWAKLPPKFGTNFAADTQWLLDGFSDRAGGWTYEQKPETARRDNSIRQYGALALWEASKRGLPVDPDYWRRLEDAFLKTQLQDGGWNYKGDREPATGSMTAAGLATLFITQDLLHAPAAVKLAGTRDNRNQQAIDRGLAWMEESFSPTENPGSFRDFYYYLYGVERVGIASGIKYFGTHDWYREGTAELIRRLCGWDEKTRTMTVHERVGGKGNGVVIRTRHLAFALMFMSRGRVPVAVNKLMVPGVTWNNRPRDVANLARHITRATEDDLNWQVVSLETEPEEWLDAPMLYLASNRALPWLDDGADGAEVGRIKRYLDLGGMLLAVNEGRARAFADSIERMGRLLYPEYAWRTLPDSHWAYTIHARVRGGQPALKALSNGVRELIVLCPSDLAGSFQAASQGEPTHFEMASNLFFYASELNRPRPRLAAHVYAPDGFVQTRLTVTVVRARHDGNWNAEPLALGVFRTYLANEHGLELRVLDRPLAEITGVTPAPKLVVVSGTEPHEFTADERQAVLQFVHGGGLVFFETPGGRGGFTLSAEQMASELFRTPIRSLLRHPVITGAGLDGGTDLSRLDYRPFSFSVFGSRETTPRLRGMRTGDDIGVIFSREDISHALLDQPRWGVSGYAPDSARRLLANLVLHAVRKKP